MPLCSKEKKKDVGDIMTEVSVRKVLTMFVQSKSSILLFFLLKESFLRRAWDLCTKQHNKHDEMKKNEREASEEGLTNYLLVFG